MCLAVDASANQAALDTDGLHLELTWDSMQVVDGSADADALPVDTDTLWRMRTTWDSIYEGRRANPVNPGAR